MRDIKLVIGLDPRISAAGFAAPPQYHQRIRLRLGRERRPYLTMELLPLSQTLVQAGQGKPLAVQIDLLVQTLALAYLHRRSILHGDLKPGNVLVSSGQVSVLDFGLALKRDHAQNCDVSGALFYLAPEVLEGAASSKAADL